ncbi:MAG: PrgI family protein [Bacilli bacterium]|nr:PrgI family protein [Bacilli bacterium]
MRTYEIPRNYKGESRILFIFSMKALMYTAIGIVPGLVFYFILNLFGATIPGIIVTILCGGVGFAIGTFKVPDTRKFKLTEKTGGENIDDVIKRAIRFKQKKNRIYVYMKEETKDEQ